MASTKKKSQKKAPPELINFKVEPTIRRALEARAKKFKAPSLSAWLRAAGLSYKPAGGRI